MAASTPGARARPVPAARVVPSGRRVAARAGDGEGGAHVHRAAGPHPPVLRIRVLRQAAALRGTRPHACSAGPSRTSSCATSSRATAGRQPRPRLAGAGPRGAPDPGFPRRAARPAHARGRARPRGPRPRRARAHPRSPEWVAAAQVLAEYDQVTALSAPGAYDPRGSSGRRRPARGRPAGPGADPREHPARGRRRRPGDDRAAARLLGVVAGPGTEVVLLGDPDSAVQTFRGADPRYLASGWTALGEGPTLVLPTAYRLPQDVRAAVGRVAPKIGALGGGLQREAAPGVRADASTCTCCVRCPRGHPRRGRAARGAPARWLAVVGHGRHRAGAGPDRHASPVLMSSGCPSRARRRTCRCATRWPCAHCWRCCGSS